MVKNCWFWDQISIDIGRGVINWSDAYNTFFIVYDTAITNRGILNTQYTKFFALSDGQVD